MGVEAFVLDMHAARQPSLSNCGMNCGSPSELEIEVGDATFTSPLLVFELPTKDGFDVAKDGGHAIEDQSRFVGINQLRLSCASDLLLRISFIASKTLIELLMIVLTSVKGCAASRGA